eukprot:TRINITY_DN90870_c0_g1_i1.p1 TRINITY_DN90870_c0_g1~~TRINITY_DN90870_c0_g1_i1.p1  ORF type:complete len:372 (+),score=42.80 TRINITY_DN90870_c0_g1_i1:421-1536(+)
MTLETLSIEGIDAESLEHLLANSSHRCEILMQWIQQLVVNSHRDGIVNAPPPILSRAFQEFANGIVTVSQVHNIKEVPFPFPYAQMITVMLMFHWIVTPLGASQYLQSPWAAGIMCFAVVAAFWSLLYIALELDMPFGNDANDLPVKKFMLEFNESLLVLAEPLTQSYPHYTHRRGSLRSSDRGEWFSSQYAQWFSSQSAHASEDLLTNVRVHVTDSSSAHQSTQSRVTELDSEMGFDHSGDDSRDLRQQHTLSLSQQLVMKRTKLRLQIINNITAHPSTNRLSTFGAMARMDEGGAGDRSSGGRNSQSGSGKENTQTSLQSRRSRLGDQHVVASDLPGTGYQPFASEGGDNGAVEYTLSTSQNHEMTVRC